MESSPREASFSAALAPPLQNKSAFVAAAHIHSREEGPFLALFEKLPPSNAHFTAVEVDHSGRSRHRHALPRDSRNILSVSLSASDNAVATECVPPWVLLVFSAPFLLPSLLSSSLSFPLCNRKLNIGKRNVVFYHKDAALLHHLMLCY